MSSFANSDGTDDYLPDEGGLTVRGIKRHIVTAANKYGDQIFLGIRHHCPLMRQNINAVMSEKEMTAFQQNTTIQEEQGFVDQWGNFLDREEAMQVVKANGQEFNIERNMGDTYLFSEGLH